VKRTVGTVLPRGQRRTSRWAVACGVVMFAAVTVTLAIAAETIEPVWRDPEYGHRLRAARQWQRDRPDRPLVVVLGSSRAQMGVSPAAMEFADEPGSPIVYNFGYRSADPVLVWLQLARLLDDGVRPRAVLVMFSDEEIRSAQPPDAVVRLWESRFSTADLRRLAPYADEPEAFRRGGFAPRNPWVARRPALVTDLPGGWRVGDRVHTGSWERMDRYGFSPYPAQIITPALRGAAMNSICRFHAALGDAERPPPLSVRMLSDLTARCRTQGIAVAACWAPDSPFYRAMWPARALTTREERARALAAALDIPIFPAPDLTDDDFAEGYHLRASGSRKYSRWLADAHLKPWLAAALK
jgi:hypothetical protein